MDKIPQEDTSPRSERETSSLLSPKRPRTDSGQSRFDIPELLTFWKPADIPPLMQTKDESLTRSAEYMTNEEANELERRAELNVTTNTQTDMEPHLEEDEQPSVAETDELGSSPAHDKGVLLAESHTPEDFTADWQRAGKSLEDGESRSFPAENDKDERKARNYVDQTQAALFSSSDAEVRCQSDYTREDVETWSQSAEVEESNQEGDEHGFSGDILLSEGEEEKRRHVSIRDHGDPKPSRFNHEEVDFVEGGEDSVKKSELQIQENRSETKECSDENDTSTKPISSAVLSAEGSALRLEVDGLSGANGESASGETIAESQSETADHTAETLMTARMSRELAEGDNDGGSVGVIDPTIWSETEKLCNSESIPVVGLSQVCETETPLLLCSDVTKSTSDHTEEIYDQKRRSEDEEVKDLCQPNMAELQFYSINKTGKEDSCWESSPSTNGNERQEDQDQTGSLFGCSPNVVVWTETTEIKEREERTSLVEEIIGNSGDETEETLEQNELEEDAEADSFMDWTEIVEIITCGGKTLTEDEVTESLECLWDHPYSADKSETEETIREEENVEETKTEGCSEVPVKSEEDLPVEGARDEAPGNESTVVGEDEERIEPRCLSETEIFKDDILAFGDAVVPGSHDLSQKFLSNMADNHPFALYEGFDTFEKIDLSLDDDDQDDVGDMLVHAEIDEHKEEEDAESSEHHAENFLNPNCDEPVDLNPTADASGQRPDCESVYGSCRHSQEDLDLTSVSSIAVDVNEYPEFEMKKQFDMVLKELNLYFEISISEFSGDSRGGDDFKKHVSSPELEPHRDTSSDDADEDPSLCGGDPVVPGVSGGHDGEQEVPFGSEEPSVYTAEKHRESLELKTKTWSPSFMCAPIMEQLSHRQADQTRRLEPLRTCSRPIRVGLSRRARTQRLHRPHPYK